MGTNFSCINCVRKREASQIQLYKNGLILECLFSVLFQKQEGMLGEPRTSHMMGEMLLEKGEWEAVGSLGKPERRGTAGVNVGDF